jgi:NAD(P)-dependent dehydrogenase (short-subunit alcohol dehydrogenase family)
MNTNNLVALITGSTRGIGKAIAHELCKEGYRVVISGTKQENVNTIVNELIDNEYQASGFAANLLSPGAFNTLIESINNKYGRLDVLVNNAGIAQADSFENITEDDYELVMGLNVKAPMFLTQAALPYLLKSPEKAIVNISSVVGHKAYANQTLYASSKHALNGMMTALAKEYQKQGLRVYNVAPGGVATEMIHTARPDLDPNSLIQPEEVAKTVAFLLSLKGNAQVDEIKIRRKDNKLFE